MYWFNIWTLSGQNDIGKSGKPYDTQKSSDPIDQKNLVQLTQMVVTTNQDSSNVNDPSLTNKEVLDNTLIHIMMFISQETQKNPIDNNEETSTSVQDNSHQV